ncbi:spindle and kinetochore-associated protein 3 [Chiloscyllium plagiosum]|uniref:spindle and kinetochore-associated protein 3 n=1 Tax=Chiloscyllium plagiosum TaxID=36176 RepID=UPI001CB86BBD|nr:spindle and kinetochore-associated protein 3 [Chiloscyllium plagiosum]XP_043547864.1 spindle and kinetochore-associated protein 3 [Chiloscyllium plagiosum]
MDPIHNFFTKLRTLAINLENETKYLDHALNNESDHEEEAPKKILHELHSEVRHIKADVQKKVETLNDEYRENSELIRAFRILQQKNCAELEEIEEHFQNYGYESLSRKNEEPQVKLTSTEKVGTENSEPELEKQNNEVATPPHEKPLNDSLRTPQLEDFGLGHLMFQSAWGEPECNQASDPKISLEFSGKECSSILQGPVIPKTPKCTLRLDDEMLLTPKLEHFGITEHTGYVNDFTLALYNKSAQPEMNSCTPIPTTEEDQCVNSVSKQIENASVSSMTQQADPNTGDFLNSPLSPVFCTPGLKIHKDSSLTPANEERKSNGSLPSPVLPCFETPWLKKQSSCQNSKNEKTTTPIEKTSSDLEQPPPAAIHSMNYLLNGCNKSPSPPLMITEHEIPQTPKAPEMATHITADVLKILLSYDANLRTLHDTRHKYNKHNLTSVNLMAPEPRINSEKENGFFGE